MKGIQVNLGRVMVRKEGKLLNWSNVPVAKIPNIFVFMALLDYIVNGRRGLAQVLWNRRLPARWRV